VRQNLPKREESENFSLNNYQLALELPGVGWNVSSTVIELKNLYNSALYISCGNRSGFLKFCSNQDGLLF